MRKDDLVEAIENFLASGSEFVHITTEVDQVNVPVFYSDLWKLAGQLNKSGLGQTEYMLSADEGTGREKQLENLTAAIVLALTDAGFRQSGEDGNYVYFSRQARE